MEDKHILKIYKQKIYFITELLEDGGLVLRQIGHDSYKLTANEDYCLTEYLRKLEDRYNKSEDRQPQDFCFQDLGKFDENEFVGCLPAGFKPRALSRFADETNGTKKWVWDFSKYKHPIFSKIKKKITK